MTDLIFTTAYLWDKLKIMMNENLENKHFQFIKPHHMRMLKIIYDHKEPLTSIELARIMGRHRSDITLWSQILLSKDFLSKKVSTKDKRKQYLYLTTKGIDLVVIYNNYVTNLNNRISTVLSDEEVTIFNNVLDKITHLL